MEDMQKTEQTVEEPECNQQTEAEVQPEMVSADSLKEAEAKRDEYLDALTRLQAEFDNYRKRANVERESAYSNGYAGALKVMLPLMDNLERAIASASQCEEIAKGLQMCYDQFFNELKKQGMEEIEAEGKKFDPNVHNAVMQEPCDDAEKSGYVSEVLQKGYAYKGRMLRYSTVKVFE